jgi:hypothetical protein
MYVSGTNYSTLDDSLMQADADDFEMLAELGPSHCWDEAHATYKIE